MEADLIYDVGLHNGDDTAFYLSRGYRVVGIDADPGLVEQCRARFRTAIEDHRLTLLNVAIGPTLGTVEFWLCEGVTEWNSLDRAVASRLGLRHHAIEVECVPFGEVLREHGVPYYLKIDIEGSDRCCVDALDPGDSPRYVSLEFNEIDDLIALRRCGYDAFKIIHQALQHHHAQFRSRPVGDAEPSRGAARQESWDDGVTGPSGWFGEDTAGDWSGFEETAYHLLSFVLGHSQHGSPPDWFTWFDIHATCQK